VEMFKPYLDSLSMYEQFNSPAPPSNINTQ
jgi:hypothetical protein